MKITEYEGQGIWIIPDFLPLLFLNEVRSDLEQIHQQGLFKNAGVGHGPERAVRSEIRRDEIHWLEGRSSVQTQLLKKMEKLKTHFNQTCYLGLNQFQGHYAVYPPGGFYLRHRDTFKSEPSRVLSTILYLNSGWKPEMGGQLRIYLPESPLGAQTENHIAHPPYIDVDPIGGKLVCFLSREIEHEVLPSHAPRYSFTGWFNDRTKIL